MQAIFGARGGRKTNPPRMDADFNGSSFGSGRLQLALRRQRFRSALPVEAIKFLN
jgi:hypothetical protein